MNEVITTYQAHCHLPWQLALWIFFVAVWYLTPIIYHSVGSIFAWIDDKKWDPTWSPWYGLYRLIFGKKYSWNKYLFNDHEVHSVFGGPFIAVIPVLAIWFWGVTLVIIVATALAHLARFVKRLSKSFKAHVEDKEAHK